MMNKLFLLLFSFTFLIGKSQDQLEMAKKNADGEYQYYSRSSFESGDEPDMKNDFQYKNAVTIEGSYVEGLYGGFSIHFGNNHYEAYGANPTSKEFICYFRLQEFDYDLQKMVPTERCVYVNSKGIWLLEMSLDEEKISIIGFIGKEAPSGKNIFKEISSSISKNKGKMKK